MNLSLKRNFGDAFYRLENNQIEKYIIVAIKLSLSPETGDIIESYDVKHIKYHRNEHMYQKDIGVIWFESIDELINKLTKNINYL